MRESSAGGRKERRLHWNLNRSTVTGLLVLNKVFHKQCCEDPRVRRWCAVLGVPESVVGIICLPKRGPTGCPKRPLFTGMEMILSPLQIWLLGKACEFQQLGRL